MLSYNLFNYITLKIKLYIVVLKEYKYEKNYINLLIIHIDHMVYIL